jgi:hypothetical protein
VPAHNSVTGIPEVPFFSPIDREVSSQMRSPCVGIGRFSRDDTIRRSGTIVVEAINNGSRQTKDVFVKLQIKFDNSAFI